MEERKMKSPSSPKSASRSGPIACPDYERAWRLGYGPPDGDKMDEAGWEEYFDAMPPVEYDKMMRRVHNLREPPPMWEGWRDELDNNLTSLSEAFKLHPECQLIWQKGYGPPDGDKLDVKGWKEYFDAMPEEEYYKMMRRVHILREPPPMWDGWRDELDKNLTSLSEAFKLHPEYQLIWRKGYGPPDSLNLDVKGWEEYLDAMPEDKRLNMNRDLSYRDGDDDIDDAINRQLREKYKYQFRQSEGFDIDVYPVGCCGIIKPIFNDIRPVCAETYYMLSNCSRIALDAYNQREGTDYTLNRVVKVCAQIVAGIMYFITFEAINSKHHLQIVQANVYAPPMMGAKEVVLVRPKAMDGMPSDKRSNMMKDLFTPPRDSHHAAELWETYLKQIKESEGFDIDVYHTDGCGIIKPMFNDTSPVSAETYYMLSNCSRTAVDAYNQCEGTDYTVNRVVKVCIQVDGGIMYFITFEAINSKDHFQVFQAKVYDPIIGANKVLLVRPRAMVKDLFMPPRDSHHDAERLEEYAEQIKETEGFDIDVCISDGDGTIVPMSYYDMTIDDSLFNYSRNALDAYNVREGTDYTLYQVVKACTQTVAGRMYYITFEAINSNNHLQVFQAKVFEPPKGPNEVLLVRLKPKPWFY